MSIIKEKKLALEVAAATKMWNLRERIARKENGESHFVAILVTIIIVIAVGLVFKTQIINFINTITTQATTEAQKLF